jgi:hypothetical protein
MSRSWQAVAHGRVREGFGQHPLGPLVFTAAAWMAVDDSAERRLAGADRRWLAAALALWATVWLWRFSRSAPR